MLFPFEYKKLNLGLEMGFAATSVTFLHIDSRWTLLESWKARVSLPSGTLYQEGEYTAGTEWLYRVIHPVMSVNLTFIPKCLLNIP